MLRQPEVRCWGSWGCTRKALTDLPARKMGMAVSIALLPRLPTKKISARTAKAAVAMLMKNLNHFHHFVYAYSYCGNRLWCTSNNLLLNIGEPPAYLQPGSAHQTTKCELANLSRAAKDPHARTAHGYPTSSPVVAGVMRGQSA